MNYGINQYKKSEENTISQQKLLIMLYDGAIRFLEQAKVCIDNRDVAGIGKNTSKAIAIVHELMNSLNFKVDPNLCQNLQSLYLFMNEQIMQANRKRDTKYLDVTISLLGTLREAWAEAAKQVMSAEASKVYRAA
jgi:flagellar protein FliS